MDGFYGFKKRTFEQEIIDKKNCKRDFIERFVLARAGAVSENAFTPISAVGDAISAYEEIEQYCGLYESEGTKWSNQSKSN